MIKDVDIIAERVQLKLRELARNAVTDIRIKIRDQICQAITGIEDDKFQQLFKEHEKNLEEAVVRIILMLLAENGYHEDDAEDWVRKLIKEEERERKTKIN
jgi:hypothetical protein